MPAILYTPTVAYPIDVLLSGSSFGAGERDLTLYRSPSSQTWFKGGYGSRLPVTVELTVPVRAATEAQLTTALQTLYAQASQAVFVALLDPFDQEPFIGQELLAFQGFSTQSPIGRYDWKVSLRYIGGRVYGMGYLTEDTGDILTDEGGEFLAYEELM